jgi:hypothetical protein
VGILPYPLRVGRQGLQPVGLLLQVSRSSMVSLMAPVPITRSYLDSLSACANSVRPICLSRVRQTIPY